MVRGDDPIGDDELVYRRIPVKANYFQPSLLIPLSPKAFQPRRKDTTGISVMRSKFLSCEEAAALGLEGQKYFIAVLKAGDLRNNGVDIFAVPSKTEPGHALITSLTSANRDEGTMYKITRLCIEVLGPFDGKAAQQHR